MNRHSIGRGWSGLCSRHRSCLHRWLLSDSVVRARIPPRPSRGPRPTSRIASLSRLAGGRALRDEPAHDQGHSLRPVPHAGRSSELHAADPRRQVRRLSPAPVPGEPDQHALRHARSACALDHDRRRERPCAGGLHRAGAGRRRHFVGDSSSGELGGRLCAACHYDEHRLDLAVVQRDGFCTSCHADRAAATIAVPDARGTNRCLQCHVRVGQTVTGQVVNSHRFTRPGAEGTGK